MTYYTKACLDKLQEKIEEDYNTMDPIDFIMKLTGLSFNDIIPILFKLYAIEPEICKIIQHTYNTIDPIEMLTGRIEEYEKIIGMLKNARGYRDGKEDN